MRVFRLVSLLPLLSMLAACSDSGDSAATSNADATVVLSTIPPSVAPPSTIPPSTIAATTTTIPVAVFPLTGLPVGASAFAARPALVAKIDNATGAQPQTGFNAADIIYEEIVNDGITRFAMVFQSADSDPVGPCRSGRIQDIDLIGSLNAPLFVWSGGNDSVTRAVNSSDLVNLGPNYAPVYFRSNAHKAPHNLYTKTSEIYTYAPPGAQPPPQQFQYRDAAEAVGGAPSSGVAVTMDNYLVNWTWNPATGLYERMQENKPQIDAATDSVVTTHNVIVLSMVYIGAGSPNAQSVGTGEAFIFTGGNYIHGTWTRADRLQPFTLTDDSGNPIKLTPGRSFIELPRIDKTTPAP